MPNAMTTNTIPIQRKTFSQWLLFLQTLKKKQLDDETQEWRGRIHHVESNETRYFRDWAALLPVLLAMVRQAQTPPAPDGDAPDAA